ncbi:MAG: Rrf2 family transcriptional regulator [Bdellovibrionaceae bacterium]|nr:Rrf2 family transcriptional regulator [Bdellovibrio sp.]
MVNQQFATAVHVLTALAFNRKQLMSSDILARSVNTNPVVIRRLLSLLAKAELVTTTRGKAGGVQLSKDPNQINLKDVYLAVSPLDPIAPRDKSPHKECAVSCSMHAIMTTVSTGTQKATLKYLESQKLSDLIKKIPKS